MFHVCWCAEGNEVKKEIQALNSLQLDLGDLKLFEDGVKMLKKFVVSHDMCFWVPGWLMFLPPPASLTEDSIGTEEQFQQKLQGITKTAGN